MIIKCLNWGNQLGFDKLKFSDGWINDALKHNGLIQSHIHEEGNYLTHEQYKKGFLYTNNIHSDCFYNKYQTGLYYHNIPNTLWVKKQEKKKYCDCKQMKDKTRTTIMACTESYFGCFWKIKEPSFLSCKLSYASICKQENAWFDPTITKWWIFTVFLNFHENLRGYGFPFGPILDNCTAHKLDQYDKKVLEGRNFSTPPPNVTSKRQPAYVGITAWLKVGYKNIILRKVLDIFYAEGGNELD